MVNTINKLAKTPKTQKYVTFGLKQVEAINKRFYSWIAQQYFTNGGAHSEFKHMTVDGHSDYKGYNSKEFHYQDFPDKIEWNLHFLDKVRNKDLANALLHEHRFPDITTFNSKPQLFDTADYIQISVTNGERGWVKTGGFPVNVYIGKDYDAKHDRPNEAPPDIAIQTDVRREALAGFEAAYQWQRFRAMALTCSDFIATQLTNESKGKEDYDSCEHMRSRRENVYPLFVELLPDTRLEEGASALKSFYRPGVLEGALALELEHAVKHQFGIQKKGDVRPIYIIKGHPIEITPTNDDGYDALMRFHVQTVSCGSDDDEQVRLAVEKQLRKHYTLEVKTPTEMEVVFELKDAHQIEQAIRDGATDTRLHRFSRSFGDALRYVGAALDAWHDTEMPAIEQGYRKRIIRAITNHFSTLETQLAGENQ